VVAANWQLQTGAVWDLGDFTQDGKVDAFDLNVLAANWEASVPVEAAIGAVIAVPEPASIAVLVCVLPGFQLPTSRARQ
jgi:hypothetical protein